MSTYTHEYSDFPNSIDDKRIFKDVKDATSTELTLINKYKTYLSNNDITSAASLIGQNPALLSYIVDATWINKVNEMLRNLEIYAKTTKQHTYIGERPITPVDGDRWIGDI